MGLDQDGGSPVRISSDISTEVHMSPNSSENNISRLIRRSYVHRRLTSSEDSLNLPS